MLPLLAAIVLHSAPVATLRKASVDLDAGDPKQLIFAQLGAPDKSELKTCGTKTAQPWTCLAWSYLASDSPQYLEILFSKTDDGMWVVSGWTL